MTKNIGETNCSQHEYNPIEMEDEELCRKENVYYFLGFFKYIPGTMNTLFRKSCVKVTIKMKKDILFKHRFINLSIKI